MVQSRDKSSTSAAILKLTPGEKLRHGVSLLARM
jgi:hypothetical protein